MNYCCPWKNFLRKILPKYSNRKNGEFFLYHILYSEQPTFLPYWVVLWWGEFPKSRQISTISQGSYQWPHLDHYCPSMEGTGVRNLLFRYFIKDPVKFNRAKNPSSSQAFHFPRLPYFQFGSDTFHHEERKSTLPCSWDKWLTLQMNC